MSTLQSSEACVGWKTAERFPPILIQATRWAGAMDVTPDAIPVIGPVTRLPGLYLSTGYSSHGFGIAPGTGHLLASLIDGSQPLVNPSSFAFERLGYS
ncbi:FAD-binding oxidoreductase [Pseudomonas sp.]|uniref:NAD(P)/FAD-dependent oxidoreductase n=1 Tax=Pseudomonas sp. TaxID=306 RepID=UPI002C65DA55|nr:FAD-binding oxidoreductase [Pseudomonas sp.]HUE94776.1 FAD-binding oxidoreductase [Pseudomonas sp.]